MRILQPDDLVVVEASLGCATARISSSSIFGSMGSTTAKKSLSSHLAPYLRSSSNLYIATLSMYQIWTSFMASSLSEDDVEIRAPRSDGCLLSVTLSD